MKAQRTARRLDDAREAAANNPDQGSASTSSERVSLCAPVNRTNQEDGAGQVAEIAAELAQT